MRTRLYAAAFALVALPVGSAMADGDFWRDVISSGATTASTYLTFKDDKLIVAARDDASSFVASGGEIRGPYLEAALQRIRSEHPDIKASDSELANAILATEE
ncbi:DUF2388 domain-containing protein [Pseudomonas sp. JS3066]|jgi:uncharacterized protein (TIGR02448 family)|uniref:DUF2388 domain-containing protein n=1 Tax=unclassified Pseudomonas TaxID=196821 RepID=UPI000EAAA0D9|nr:MULTISPECIES: DUF2388 domain-containing protein [unclassified Pseudomonas]AYF89545.1 DUF2388 domain-containing protein [Pseudomonas sp. DY-1]MDH4656089.1 DUF2388 domain-containing protein [Pseudomonas sp. BN606]MRK21302.1 DUF2388 domain-containing protein [Pseudomonas sp. JG-B]WVK92900.1 DUF2388 domain-containing protein [Pseudomonas sp. JS3066]